LRRGERGSEEVVRSKEEEVEEISATSALPPSINHGSIIY
jgi:hypothetical protein